MSNNTFWVLLLLAGVVGLASGFAVPLAASYQPKNAFHETPTQEVLEVVPVAAPVVSNYDVARDLEVEQLAARNRRLEALVASLRRRKAEAQAPKPLLDELGAQP